MKLCVKIFSLLLVVLALAACTTETIKDGAPQKNTTEASSLNVQLGLQYLQQGNTSRAKQKLLLAVKQDASQQSYGALAYFYEQTGEASEAETFYQKAIAQNPQAGAGHNNYGAFLCRQKQYQKAEQQFQLAVNDPKYLNDAGAYENAGLCALLIPDNAKAILYFSKSVQQNPKMSTSLYQLARLSFANQSYGQAYLYAQQYLKSQQVTAAGLLLGARIAKAYKKPKAVREFGFLLKTQFPKSREYQQYQRIAR